MPTYEYQCHKCKKKFELFQMMTAKPLSKCVHCGGRAERLIGAGAGLIFKGSGFYITDYKKPSQAAKTSPKQETGSKPEAKPEKSETKSKDPAKQ